MAEAAALVMPDDSRRDWDSASLMPRGKDEFGNDTLMFGDKPIRAAFDRGSRPMLVLIDVLTVCGIPTKNRKHLDIRGITQTGALATPGGTQKLRIIDLDDAYRVALQGRSIECMSFRDFVIELLRKVESGQPINAAPAPATSGSILTQTIAALHNVAVELDAQNRRLVVQEQRVDVLAAHMEKIEAGQAEAEAGMKSLPEPSVQAPEKSQVDLTEQRVRFWVGRNKSGNVFQSAWNRLYEEIRRRLHFDVNRRFDPSVHKSKLDILRTTPHDFQAKVYALACELFPLEPFISY